MRSEWPPEVREAYERGAAVWWSPVRGRWVADGRVVEVAEQPSEEIGQLEPGPDDATTEESSPVARRYPYRTLSPTVDPRPAPPARCPRCGGTILRSTDEHGERDDHCLACSWRADALTPEQAEALKAEMNPREGTRRRAPSIGGLWL